jgi:hypothetical protein
MRLVMLVLIVGRWQSRCGTSTRFPIERCAGAFEDLAEIALEQVDIRRFQDTRQERAQEQNTLCLWIEYQRQGLSLTGRPGSDG